MTGPSLVDEPLPFLHQGHPLFDMARRVVGGTGDRRTLLYDPLHEDLLSVATLALLEGRDPHLQVQQYRAAEYTWRRLTRLGLC